MSLRYRKRKFEAYGSSDFARVPKAARTIQSAFRSYRRRKYMPVYSSRPVPSSAERKEVVTYINSTVNAQTPTSIVQGLTLVAQGTDTTNRVGRKISHNYIDIKVAITPSNAGTGDSGFWAVLLDRQNDGTTPAFGDMFDTSVVTVPGLAPRNTLLYQDRFKVLAIEEFACGTPANQQYYCHRFIDLTKLSGQDRTQNFNSTGAGVGDINHGIIWFVCGSAVALAASATAVKAGVKYRFTDV